MKRIKGFLKYEYEKGISALSKDCLSIEELYNYKKGALPLKEKKRIESHLAKCYPCLDNLVSIHNGLNFYNKVSGPMGHKSKRRFKLKKVNLFLIFAVICFLSSFIFSRYFLQFLAATIILSIKWIVDSKTTKMLVMIYDAWKRGGEREAGRVLKDIETKKRIDL